jgi:propanol-preferring alcohol dehydrogenase
MSYFGTRCAGHEGAGVIVQVGDRVKNLKVGQRAGFKPIVDVCHSCDSCRSGRETYCARAILTGLMADGKMSRSSIATSITSSRRLEMGC